MYKQNSYILTIILLVALLISCTQEIDESIENKDAVLIEEGVLTFKSKNAFLETLEHLKTLSNEDIILWINDIGFGNSHFMVQDYYDSLPTDTDLSLSEKLKDEGILYIPDPSFSAILNEEGLYKIGKEYHKITENKEYISENYDMLMTSSINAKSDEITVFELNPLLTSNIQKANLNGQTLCAKNPTTSYVGEGFYGGKYFNKFHPYPEYGYCGGGDYSFHTETWYTQYSNFYSVGSWIKGRKYKKKGLRKKWRDDKVTFLKVNQKEGRNVTKLTEYFTVQAVWHIVQIQDFNISYEYNDESKGLRKVNMTLRSLN